MKFKRSTILTLLLIGFLMLEYCSIAGQDAPKISPTNKAMKISPKVTVLEAISILTTPFAPNCAVTDCKKYADKRVECEDGWISYDDFMKFGNQVIEIPKLNDACRLLISTHESALYSLRTNWSLVNTTLLAYPRVYADVAKDFQNDITENPKPKTFRRYAWYKGNDGKNYSEYLCSATHSKPCNWFDHSIAMTQHNQRVDLKAERKITKASLDQKCSKMNPTVPEQLVGARIAGCELKKDLNTKDNIATGDCYIGLRDRCFQAIERNHSFTGSIAKIPDLMYGEAHRGIVNVTFDSNYDHLAVCTHHEVFHEIEKDKPKKCFEVTDYRGLFHTVCCCASDCENSGIVYSEPIQLKEERKFLYF